MYWRYKTKRKQVLGVRNKINQIFGGQNCTESFGLPIYILLNSAVSGDIVFNVLFDLLVQRINFRQPFTIIGISLV